MGSGAGVLVGACVGGAAGASVASGSAAPPHAAINARSRSNIRPDGNALIIGAHSCRISRALLSPIDRDTRQSVSGRRGWFGRIYQMKHSANQYIEKLYYQNYDIYLFTT